MRVTFGDRISRLQEFVDRRYGEGRINVKTDYLGARRGDIDPWFWIGDRLDLVRIQILRRGSRHIVGWYLENHDRPILPAGGGVLFNRAVLAREEGVVTFDRPRTRFGFYVMREGPDNFAANAGGDCEPDETRRYFTNRLLNDRGPGGAGAVHPPFDGDVQVLVFDVSRWAGPGTWLLCFEDRDSGGPIEHDVGPGHRYDAGGEEEDDDPSGCGAPDNDFNDVIFEVRADGATPAHAMSFGSLKLRYR